MTTSNGSVHCPERVIEQLRTPRVPPAKRRRVYMSFVRNADQWHCRFHKDDLQKTAISRRFAFRVENIFEAARRGHGLTSVESRLDLDESVALGRGGTWLLLTEEQYSALVQSSYSDNVLL